MIRLGRKRRSVAWLVVMFVSVVGAALAHVSLRLGVIRMGYAIGEETRDRRLLQEENRKLRLEKSLLRSPARIEDIAREKLGMARPDPTRVRVVRPDAPSGGGGKGRGGEDPSAHELASRLDEAARAGAR
jgi:cell division protein FtsL